MSVTNKALIDSKEMEAAQTTQYTAPSTARTTIDAFVATNTSVSSATISIHLVPNTLTPADSNSGTMINSCALATVAAATNSA